VSLSLGQQTVNWNLKGARILPNIPKVLWAPFKFQLTLSAQPLAGLGWRLKAES
jgi:hypothetical protein